MVINPNSKNSSKEKKPVVPNSKPKSLSRCLAAIRLGCLVAVAVGASSQTSVTQANNLDNFLKDMYSNTTDAGYFQTQQRGVISGGGFTARVPIKPINIIQFDPPRVSAGCGGINLFGGSFSFINAKELTQLLRTIAQNALGLLFQLGLNAISQPLSSLLTSWSKKLQEMNSALKNTCEAARKLFQIDWGGSTLSQTWESMKGVTSTGTGAFKDYFSGVKQRFQEGWSELRGSGQNGETRADKAAKEIDSSGNVTWRALNASNSYKSVVSRTGGNEEEVKLLLMNIIGTEVFPTTEQQQGECTGGQGNCEPKPRIYRSTVTIQDLMSPDPNRDVFFVCAAGDNSTNEEGCSKEFASTSMSSMFKGTAYIVNKAFYDINSADLVIDAETIARQISAGKGIIGKSGKAGATLTEDETRLLNAMPISIVRYMNALRNQPAQMASLAEMVREYVIKDMAVNLIYSLANAAEATFNSGNVKARPPQGMDESLRKFRLQAYQNDMKPDEKVAYMKNIHEFVNFAADSQYHPTFPVARK